VPTPPPMAGPGYFSVSFQCPVAGLRFICFFLACLDIRASFREAFVTLVATFATFVGFCWNALTLERKSIFLGFGGTRSVLVRLLFQVRISGCLFMCLYAIFNDFGSSFGTPLLIVYLGQFGTPGPDEQPNRTRDSPEVTFRWFRTPSWCRLHTFDRLFGITLATMPGICGIRDKIIGALFFCASAVNVPFSSENDVQFPTHSRSHPTGIRLVSQDGQREPKGFPKGAKGTKQSS